MKATLCVKTLENTAKAYPGIRGAVIHSDYAEENTMPKTWKSLDIMWNG